MTTLTRFLFILALAFASTALPASAPAAQPGPASQELTIPLVLSKTVGTTAGVCAVTHEITLTAGSTAYYCFSILNNSPYTLSLHTLADDHLGVIFTGLAYDVPPGAGVNTVQAGLSIPAVINVTTVNTATWSAVLPGIAAYTATTTARVNVVPPIASIVLTKTVGHTPGVCAPTSAVDALAGMTVYYCYTVQNNGTLALAVHDLVDSHLGTIFTGLSYSLSPGSVLDSVSAGLSIPAVINATTVNTATWTARGASGLSHGAGLDMPDAGTNGVPSASAGSSATVTVVSPSIVLTKTVGADPGACAASDVLALPQNGGTVVYCYTVQNMGDIVLEVHNLVDNKLGDILSEFAYSLAPGATRTQLVTATITQTTVNTATWTAENCRCLQAQSTDVATVTVEHPTAIDVLAFTATPVSAAKCGRGDGPGCARLAWAVAREAGVVGYRLLRAEVPAGAAAPRGVAVSIAGLISSAGGEGAAYEWLDRTAGSGGLYAYWLQIVDGSGATAEYGPTLVSLGTGLLDPPEPPQPLR